MLVLVLVIVIDEGQIYRGRERVVQEASGFTTLSENESSGPALEVHVLISRQKNRRFMAQAATQTQSAPLSAGDAPLLTLIHFGDLHVWRLGLDGELYPKRFFGLANLLLRRGRSFPEGVGRAVVRQISRERADGVLFSGDLTTTSLRAEFLLGRRLLDPIVRRWGERFIAIPGNHDRYTPGAVRARLFESLFLGRRAEFPFALDLDERWTLVGFDCSVARLLSSRGRMSPEGLAPLDAILAEQERRGRRLVVMGHYPLLYPPGRRPSWEHVLPERARVREVLERRGVRVYLHGHTHFRWRLEADGMTHLNCGSAGQAGRHPEHRPGYLKIQLGPGRVESVRAIWLSADPRAADAAAWRDEELVPQQM